MNFYLGVGAAWKTAQVEQGSTVVIFGLGSIGLAVKSQFSISYFNFEVLSLVKVCAILGC